MNIRPYISTDQNAIIQLFKLNTPTYFSPDEERDLLEYLERYSANYYVIEDDSNIAGCGGINISEGWENRNDQLGYLPSPTSEKRMGNPIVELSLTETCGDQKH
jgi:hypothetical protein